MMLLTAKGSEQVNSKCPPGITMLQDYNF